MDPEDPSGFALSIPTLGLKNESPLGAGDIVSRLRSLVVFSEDLVMVSVYPHGASQPFMTPVPKDLIPSPELYDT